MKKTLAIVLALAMALSMFASMAFVLNPGAGDIMSDPIDDAIVITDFFVTNDDVINGLPLAVYTDLVDNTDGALYIAKNEIIRIALTFDILNDKVVANKVVAPTTAPIKIDFTSSTVDLSLAQHGGMSALRVPYPIEGSLIDAVKITKNTETNPGFSYEANKLDPAYNTLTTNLVLYTGSKTADSGFLGNEVWIGCKFDNALKAKYSYALIFSGITKGEITEKGAVSAKLNFAGEQLFTETDKVVVKTVNGHTYIIEKVPALHGMSEATAKLDTDYYTATTGGYIVYSVAKENNVYVVRGIAQLDTESVKFGPKYSAELQKKEVEGLGNSLGLVAVDYTTPSTATIVYDKDGKTFKDVTAINLANAASRKPAFRTVLSDGTVKYITDANGTDAFQSAEHKAAFETMLVDLGLSTADTYTYKIVDEQFTDIGAYKNVLVAEYNNGVVAPIESEDEADVQEGTEDEEIVEDEVVEEEIVEDEIVEEEVEVPTTGDATASVVLAAAAIMAAAALAFVMKKVRD